jgi:two-component system, OmpR family, sensor histidine kinase KdpD
MIKAVATLPTLEMHEEPNWRKYLLDTLLAVLGALSITGIIYIFQLYPRIPNISIVYLLMVLALASTRGRYAALLTSFVAFLSFDYFLVPPLYVFTISRLEEWIALFIFLVTALLTGQLAVLLRQRAEEASRRERETHILYELVRTTNGDEPFELQFQTIVQAVVTVFASWGVRECALLLPDTRGEMSLQASAPQSLKEMLLTSDERAMAKHVLETGRTMGLHDVESLPHTSMKAVSHVVVRSTGSAHAARIRLIPLKTGKKVIGVLHLRLAGGPLSMQEEERLGEMRERSNPRTTFFWTFLDQVTSVIERMHLRKESLRIEVLQRTDELRAALLSSVSHDLRTPLASIKAAASSLQQEDVSWDEETRQSFVQTIEREADRLNRLVGNLLDMSRIEGGALKPEKDWYEINELIQDVLKRMQPLLKSRTVTTELPSDLPLIEFDYVQMDQVLTNLIENAVRYTPPDTPLDVGVEEQTGMVGAGLTPTRGVLIHVADRGPGIPQADLERVFDKFYRVQQKRQHPMGSGLGLAVCKGIVEAHGGRIWAKPREGGGVIFYVTLPGADDIDGSGGEAP